MDKLKKRDPEEVRRMFREHVGNCPKCKPAKSLAQMCPEGPEGVGAFLLSWQHSRCQEPPRNSLGRHSTRLLGTKASPDYFDRRAFAL